MTAQEAAAACGAAPGDESSAYARDFTFLGTRYRVEGRCVGVGGDGLMQLESVAPAEQAALLRPLFTEWAGKHTGPTR